MLCILSFICYIVLRPYLKQYNPQTAKRIKGMPFSKIQRKELNKHYANYFTLTNQARHSLAESLGMTYTSLSKWMQRKNNLQLERAKQQPQTLREQGHEIDAAGI